MKKLLGRIALISFALITAACGNKGSSAEASSMKPSVSSDTSISSVEKSSSSSASSKTYSSNYQLSTASGLKVYFKEQGARIDKIEYNGKQSNWQIFHSPQSFSGRPVTRGTTMNTITNTALIN